MHKITGNFSPETQENYVNFFVALHKFDKI